MKTYSMKFREKIIEIYFSEKISYHALGKRLGCSYNTVRIAIKRHLAGEPLVTNIQTRISIGTKGSIVAAYVRNPVKYGILAEQFGVSESTVKRLIKKHKAGEPLEKKTNRRPKVKLVERSEDEQRERLHELSLVGRGISANEYLYRKQ